MARPALNIDVEYGEIELAGVWYSVEDINKLMERLRDIMIPREWLNVKAEVLQHSIGMLNNVSQLIHNGYSKDQLTEAIRKQIAELRKQIEEAGK